MAAAFQQVPGRTVSGWATVALVLGIASPFTCMLTALPAVIVGVVALVKIGGSNGRRTGTGMAIAGMALPVVLLPLMALGMGIVMPALVRVRQVAFRKTCETNLEGLGRVMQIYAGDNNGRFPRSSQWCDLITDHIGTSGKELRCQGASEGPCNYAMNKAVEPWGASAPPDMVLLFETTPGWNQVGGPEILTVDNHQGDGCNVLFVDGHVEFVKLESLQYLRWTTSGLQQDDLPSGEGQRAPPR